MNKGFVSVYRKIQDHFIWQEKPFDKAHAWVDLLIMANHKKREVLHKGKVYEVGRGEILISKVKLAERWGWSRPKLYRFFDLLTERGMIKNIVTPDITPNVTHIKLVNYSKFQDKRTRNVTQDDTLGVTLPVTQTIIKNNYNNYSNNARTHAREEREDENQFPFSSDDGFVSEEYKNSDLYKMMKKVQEERK